MSNADNINNLLIIAGRDNYPKIIMEAAKQSGVKKIHVIAFKGETKKRNLNLADSISWIRVGELQKMIDIINELADLMKERNVDLAKAYELINGGKISKGIKKRN